ncbi:hypothetical protein TYRP_006482 [Tyrophagus putrescentiae]|nr:hypothetical protein TYRP_006482 [Tyrophagus putrescentiae]
MSSSSNNNNNNNSDKKPATMVFDITRKEGSLLKRLKNRFIETVITGPEGLEVLTYGLKLSETEDTPQHRYYWAYPNVLAFDLRQQLWTTRMAFDDEGTGPLHTVSLQPLDTLAAIKFQQTMDASRHRVRFTWVDPHLYSYKAGGLHHQYLYMDFKTQEAMMADLAAAHLLAGPPVQRGFGVSMALRPYLERVQREEKEKEKEEAAGAVRKVQDNEVKQEQEGTEIEAEVVDLLA